MREEQPLAARCLYACYRYLPSHFTLAVCSWFVVLTVLIFEVSGKTDVNRAPSPSDSEQRFRFSCEGGSSEGRAPDEREAAEPRRSRRE